jgi:hypothetical protein
LNLMFTGTWREQKDYAESPRERKTKSDIQPVLRLISFLDAFAANNFDDYSKFDRMAREGDIDPRVSAEWTATKPLLDQIFTHLKKIPQLKLLLRIQLLSRVSSILLILLAIPFFMWQSLAFTVISVVGIILLYAGIAMLLVPTLVGRRIARVLSDYFSSYDEQLRLPRRQLRAHIQRLIQIARDIAIEQKIPSDKLALALYSTDYDGITSAQRGPLSKKYWASLDLGAQTDRSKENEHFH